MIISKGKSTLRSPCVTKIEQSLSIWFSHTSHSRFFQKKSYTSELICCAMCGVPNASCCVHLGATLKRSVCALYDIEYIIK